MRAGATLMTHQEAERSTAVRFARAVVQYAGLMALALQFSDLFAWGVMDARPRERFAFVVLWGCGMAVWRVLVRPRVLGAD